MHFKNLLGLFAFLVITQSLHLHSHLQSDISSCVSPGLYNATTKQCDCKNGSVLDAAKKSCVCTTDLPLLENGTCYACKLPNVYDPKTNKCYSCPDGYRYNLSTNLCDKINCDNGKVFVQAKQSCGCPDSTPYDYKNSCNKCPENNYFGDGKCKPCWEGAYFNTTTRLCQCN